MTLVSGGRTDVRKKVVRVLMLGKSCSPADVKKRLVVVLILGKVWYSYLLAEMSGGPTCMGSKCPELEVMLRSVSY